MFNDSGTYTTFYMELIPCINCVSVVDEGDLKVLESFGHTFFREIGSGDTHSDFLYKTYWLSWRVNFLDETDYKSFRGSIHAFLRLSEF